MNGERNFARLTCGDACY